MRHRVGSVRRAGQVVGVRAAKYSWPRVVSLCMLQSPPLVLANVPYEYQDYARSVFLGRPRFLMGTTGSGDSFARAPNLTIAEV